MKWENISIFISSTFQDMHGERDYLVKEVFPELLDWCERRRLHMYDIDLRWGITREDSTSRNTVSACLHNIDRCRPFFICFLGQRRGWVPGEKDISEDTALEYPGLSSVLGQRSVTELEIEHALLSPMNRMYSGALRQQPPCRRALFYFRSDRSAAGIPDAEKPTYVDPPESLGRVREFRQVIAESGYSVTEYDGTFETDGSGHGRFGHFTAGGKELGRVILEQLKEQISAEFPDHTAGGEPEESADTAAIQEEFIRREENSYCPQQDDLDEMKRYLASDERQALCVTARSGMGKTSLMCALAREYRGSARLICRFCGISPDTSDLYALFAGILRECGLPVPSVAGELFGNIGLQFRKIAAQGETVLLIDGLNQCTDGLGLFELLPRELPDGLRIILSCKEESLRKDLTDRIGAYQNIRFWRMKTWCDERFRRGMIDRFLSLYLKRLDEDAIRLITNAEGAGSPLFISVILSELRVFGRFQEIEAQIGKFSGDTDAAFREILIRLEDESGSVGRYPLSEAVFGLLARSRIGLSESEILSALNILTGADEDTVRPALRVLLRQVRPFLARRGLLYDFFHESFRNAADARYAVSGKEFHAALAGAFRLLADPDGDERYFCMHKRPLTEYPYHLYASGGEASLARLLMNPEWIRRKLTRCGMQALLTDYEWAKGSAACTLTCRALRLSASALMQDPDQLASQLIGRLNPRKNELPEIKTLLDRLADGQKSFWLKPLNGAFTPPEDGEISFRHGPYAITAMCVHLDRLVCVDESNRIGIYDRQTGERLSLIEAEGGSVRCLATDGRMLYAGCGDGTVSVWQTQSQSLFRVLRVCDSAINSLSIDGSILYAAAESGDCVAYDLHGYLVKRVIRTGKYPLLAAAAEGGRICFGGMNQRAEILDGDKRTVWKTNCGYVGGIVLSGSRLVFTTFYPRLFFRDLAAGTCTVTDYTDGYDFAVSESSVMFEWRNKGPYIRSLIGLGKLVAVATPFSAAVFPLEGAKEALTAFPCPDARALAAADGVLYVGNGKGRILSFRTDKPSGEKTGLPPYAVTAIAREGTHVAVASETAVTLYETGSDGALLPRADSGLETGIPGYFTDVVPWKGGFAAGSFCEFTRWRGFEESKWSVLHRSLILMEGENTSYSSRGTQKMLPMRDHLVFLTGGNEIYVKAWHGPLRGEMLGKDRDYTRIRIGRAGTVHETGPFGAAAACSDTVFAAASRQEAEILVIACDAEETLTLKTILADGAVRLAAPSDSSEFQLIKTFPTDSIVSLMEASPDGLLYTLESDSVIRCYDPYAGRECTDPVTGAPMRIPVDGKPLKMAVTADHIYVSLEDGCLEVFSRRTGILCDVTQADSDIKSICVSGDGPVLAGTSGGRLMIFREENRDTAESRRRPSPVTRDDREKPDGRVKPRPVIRSVPPNKDSNATEIIRTACHLMPVIAVIAAILLRHGGSGLFYAFIWGGSTRFISIFGGFWSAMFLMLNLTGVWAMHRAVDFYYRDTRRWWRSYKLPVLDRVFLPLTYLLLAVPGAALTAQREALPLALLNALTVPAMFTVIYFQGIDLMQKGGVTRQLSKDKTFITMEQAFWNIRIAALALTAACVIFMIWAIVFRPQWFIVTPR